MPASPCVLDEDDALELLAFLVTAARTQVDEAASTGRCGCSPRRIGSGS